MRKVLIFVIDGCAPEYLTEKTAPDIFRLAKQDGGFCQNSSGRSSDCDQCQSCLYSFRRFSRGYTCNRKLLLQSATGEQGFIESHGFMKAPTILQRYQAAGGKTALLTVKGKVLEVFGEGVHLGLSVQNPDPSLLEKLELAPPPQVQSPDSSRWIFHAAYQCIKKKVRIWSTVPPTTSLCTTMDLTRLKPRSKFVH